MQGFPVCLNKKEVLTPKQNIIQEAHFNVASLSCFFPYVNYERGDDHL